MSLCKAYGVLGEAPLKIQVAHEGTTPKNGAAHLRPAYRGWITRYARKVGLVTGAFFFCFIFFPRRDAYGKGVQKKMKTGLDNHLSV